jgi:hypothetical protein
MAIKKKKATKKAAKPVKPAKKAVVKGGSKKASKTSCKKTGS